MDPTPTSYWSISPTTISLPDESESRESPHNLTVQIIDETSALPGLQTEWCRLASISHASTIYQTFDWQYQWWLHFGNRSNHHLFVLLVKQQDQLVGLAPFFLLSHSPLKHHLYTQLLLLGSGLQDPQSPVRFLAKDGPSDYLDILSEPGWEVEVADTLVHYLKQEYHLWDEISWQNVREDSLIYQHVLPLMANNQFEIHRKVTDICPRIILPDTIQQEQATLDPRLSQWLDRIEHNPEIEIEDRSSNGQVAGTLQMLSHVHQKRWNAQGYPGLFSDQRFEDFQRNLAQALARRDRIWMKNLVYQGNNLATHMGFTFNGHVYTYLSDHDQTQSPDPTTATVTENPVLWELVQDAITANKQVVDLGRGSADYKFDWASTMNRNWELRIRTSPSKQLAAKMSYVKQRGYYHIRQLHSRIRYETHILQTLTEEHGHGWALPTYLIKAARRFMQRLQWEQQRYKLKNPHPSISAQDWPKSSKLAPVKLNRNFRSDTYTEAVDSHNESDFRLDIIRTPSDLPVIQSSWDALATSMGSPMLSYPWFYASSMAFGGRSPLYVMTLKDKKDNIRAIAPLGRKESMPPRFELLGSSILREPSSLLYTDPVALRVAIQKMLDLNQPITLRGLRLYGPVSKILEQELKQRSYRSKKSSARIPYVAIRKSWEEFEREDISSSRRSSFRRLKRKAEKHGPLRLEVVTPTPENVASYLEQVYRIEAANWKGRAGTAIQTHPTLNVFFRILAHQMAEQGRLRLYFLNVGDKMVAVQYNLMYDQQLWIYKIGYDEQWAWCSPGILLMHEVIKHSFAQSLEAVEFLGTDASWLHIWATDWHSLRSYELYPKNVVGSLARPRDLLQQAYHKIEARIRERRAMNI